MTGGKGPDSLRTGIDGGSVNPNDVLVLTYGDGDELEVLYDGKVLKAAGDVLREVRQRHSTTGLAELDFTAWERKGTYKELYG